jgi:hypothetical protein
LQHDVSVIKNELNLRPTVSTDSVKSLSADKIEFIETLENLVNDGAPFDGFIDNCDDTIDMKKYASSESLLKFARQHIKSVNAIEKEFINVGANVFDAKHIKEGFWDRQKRVIKEKFKEAMKKKDDKENSFVGSDNDLFNQAMQQFYNKKIEDSLLILEKIKLENEAFSLLKADLRKRVELDKAFSEFKKEYISAESQSSPESETAAEKSEDHQEELNSTEQSKSSAVNNDNNAKELLDESASSEKTADNSSDHQEEISDVEQEKNSVENADTESQTTSSDEKSKEP